MEILEKIILIIFYLFQLWIISYFILVVLFVLVDLFNINLSSFPAKKKELSRKFSFAAIVPLHQNIDFLEPILDSLRKQNYSRIEFFIIADDCPKINLSFDDHRVHILYPEIPLHSKIKSIQLALETISENQFDAIAIFDADNLIHPDFFTIVNEYFNKGFKAFQSNLLPKNLDTTFSRLDSINDQYYNFIDRLSPSRLNLCAHISGRGTVVDLKMYKAVSYSSIFGGFDKKLQCEVAKKTNIGFSENAILYDEKVSNGADMQVQRTRWINAYFRYFSEAFKIFKQGIRQGKFRLAFFGYNNMRPPLFIQIIFSILIVIINAIYFPVLFKIWAICLGVYFISFIYITTLKNKVLDIATSFKTIFQIPLFFVRQVRALFNIKKANRKFLQTNNYKIVFINDILKTENDT